MVEQKWITPRNSILEKNCGQVAMSNQNFVVPDVKAQDNYIACSFTVKSEIVVPICKYVKMVK